MNSDGETHKSGQEIEHLSRLRTSGLLSEKEFIRQRDRLLKAPSTGAELEYKPFKWFIQSVAIVVTGILALVGIITLAGYFLTPSGPTGSQEAPTAGVSGAFAENNQPPATNTETPQLRVALGTGEPRCMTAPGGSIDTDDGSGNIVTIPTPPSTSCAPPQPYLKVTNADTRPVKLIRVIINGRSGDKNCDLVQRPVPKDDAEKKKQDDEEGAAALLEAMTGIAGPAYLPDSALGTGDYWSYESVSRCGETISVSVITDRGSAEYHFGT